MAYVEDVCPPVEAEDIPDSKRLPVAFGIAIAAFAGLSFWTAVAAGIHAILA
ncbi:MAG: hypothetical protein JWO84_347 [Parcubacteria group bacterium]|nr:hypothetical protein [Parcubacteria group bacterium]